MDYPSRPFAAGTGRLRIRPAPAFLKLEGTDKSYHKASPAFCKAERLLKQKSSKYINNLWEY
jgi:hypothetical protein